MPAPWNPREEAFERIGGRYDVRVLEPSPPAVTTGPWFADDPAAVGRRRGGREVVTPTTAGDLTWDELAREDDDLAGWCAERWLGAWRRLGPPPPTLAATRDALHRVAEQVMTPTRQRANGKIGLRYTRGGFGTPFFGPDAQVRVEGDVLVVVRGEEVWRGRLTTLRGAAEFVGHELTRFDEALDDAPLDVDATAARWLGDWYGFGASVLEQLRVEAAAHEPSRVQLWPEHFDIAFDAGGAEEGTRANYGLSPGDEDHPEPYVYVSLWKPRPRDPDLWPATTFPGAALPLADVLAAGDQRAAVLEFLRTRLRALTG